MPGPGFSSIVGKNQPSQRYHPDPLAIRETPHRLHGQRSQRTDGRQPPGRATSADTSRPLLVAAYHSFELKAMSVTTSGRLSARLMAFPADPCGPFAGFWGTACRAPRLPDFQNL